MNINRAISALKEGKKVMFGSTIVSCDKLGVLTTSQKIFKPNMQVCKTIEDLLEVEAMIVYPLDEEERKYLEAVLEPYKKNFDITVQKESFSTNLGAKECLTIRLYYRREGKPLRGFWSFPEFKRGLMYKDMKPGKEYTIGELGLWE